MSRKKTNRAEIAADRARLAELYPVCFVPKGSRSGARPKLPLKIGINKDVINDAPTLADGTPMSRRRIRAAIRDYVSGPKYARALVAGGARFGLYGHPAGEVAAEHMEHAARYLASRGATSTGSVAETAPMTDAKLSELERLAKEDRLVRPEALAAIRECVAFAGEVRLRRWSDSERGATVTFDLHPDDAAERHPFRGLGNAKPRFQLLLLPIADTDEEQPKPQEPEPPPVEEKPKRAWRDISRSQQAGIKCSDAEFQRWVATARLHLPPADVTPAVAAAMAATFVRNFCGVNTRAELDRDIAAADRWDVLLTEYEIAAGRLARP